MSLTPRSALLLLLLTTIVVFFVGFRFGRRVERIDKSYVAPTAVVTDAPTPTQTKTEIKTFNHEGCQVSFLYPSELQINSSSTGATLSQGEQSINFSCEKKATDDFVKNHPATSEAKTVRSAGQSVRVYREKEASAWSVLNTATGSKVVFEVTSSLADLVLRTINFSAKTVSPTQP